MVNSDVKVITLYISVWGWQILSMLSFSTSLIMFALPTTLMSNVLFVVFFLLFMAGQYMAHKRKGEMYAN